MKIESISILRERAVANLEALKAGNTFEVGVADAAHMWPVAMGSSPEGDRLRAAFIAYFEDKVREYDADLGKHRAT
jgi:hypothetical protein